MPKRYQVKMKDGELLPKFFIDAYQIIEFVSAAEYAKFVIEPRETKVINGLDENVGVVHPTRNYDQLASWFLFAKMDNDEIFLLNKNVTNFAVGDFVHYDVLIDEYNIFDPSPYAERLDLVC